MVHFKVWILPYFIRFLGSNVSNGLPWWLSCKEPVYQCRRHKFDPCVREIPLKKEIATYFSILAWKIS